ncbi:hypothetical protein HZI73_04075 [Vallitalea pronyensis]|uniref:SGNH hydrolase-type esterase domain-containing protein n=1 Tax=Vallitalea pronyensis TaxID=1348613 RepID=A0A8J8MHF0_9FIRM|nr:GDSL-type esterase/lipase family protein [Vallitalea pronyensis]QUI21517.1 hypothetical protein HZI73_04075 [Vallitalea pronyensis]
MTYKKRRQNKIIKNILYILKWILLLPCILVDYLICSIIRLKRRRCPHNKQAMFIGIGILVLSCAMVYYMSGNVFFGMHKENSVPSVSAHEDSHNDKPMDMKKKEYGIQIGVDKPYNLFMHDMATQHKELTSSTFTDSPTDALNQEVKTNDMTVKENQSIDDNFFQKTLFIGNSRTKGLYLASAPKGATFYAHEGLLVNNALTKTFIKQKDNQLKISIPEALSKQSFDKVYLMFGTNELGWVSLDTFINYYQDIIDTVQQHNEDATIYVQAILPVSEKKSESTTIYTNDNIVRFNEKIMTMCKEENIHYLDTWASVANDKGVLPDEASTDGIHLNKTYTEIWLDYIRRHTIQETSIKMKDRMKHGI